MGSHLAKFFINQSMFFKKVNSGISEIEKQHTLECIFFCFKKQYFIVCYSWKKCEDYSNNRIVLKLRVN